MNKALGEVTVYSEHSIIPCTVFYLDQRGIKGLVGMNIAAGSRAERQMPIWG